MVVEEIPMLVFKVHMGAVAVLSLSIAPSLYPLFTAVHVAGLYPSTWPLPLTKQGLAAAAQNPVLQSLPSGPVPVKRQPNHYGSDGAVTIKAEKV